MGLLLDTHVLIWSQEAPEKLGAHALSRMKKSDERLFFSAISALEIARLIHVGRIRLKGSLANWIEAVIEAVRCQEVDVTRKIAIEAYQLPGSFHKDPADRILAATARSMSLSLVTADERILAYASVKTLDART